MKKNIGKTNKEVNSGGIYIKDYDKDVKLNRKPFSRLLMIILLLFILFILMSLIKMFQPINYEEEINKINDYSEFPYEIGMPIDQLNKYNFDEIQWIKEVGYNNIEVRYYKNNGEELGFSGFPDYSDNYRLTFYKTFDSNCSLFGIHIGEKVNNVRDVLEKRGYFLVSTSQNSLILDEYRKRKIHIFLYSKGELFKGFNIILNSTDKNHKDYYK